MPLVVTGLVISGLTIENAKKKLSALEKAKSDVPKGTQSLELGIRSARVVKQCLQQDAIVALGAIIRIDNCPGSNKLVPRGACSNILASSFIAERVLLHTSGGKDY